MTKPDSSPFFGVTRREFLKYCGYLAVAIGAGNAATTEVAMALERLARRPQVVWSSFQVCTGCAIQLLESRKPPVAQLILQQISLEYQENVMAAAGHQSEAQLEAIVDSGDFFWIAEGSIPYAEPGMMTSGGKTGQEILRYIYPNARAVIANGNCACYGNIQASRPNPSGAVGIDEALRREGIYDAAKPVINMSRCPGNADDLLTAFTYVLVNGEAPPLDNVGRPKILFGEVIHDHCERRGHYEAGEFVEPFGDPQSQLDWCWYKMGCKGPQTFAPCPTTRWNGGLSWCVHNGPCKGCAEPGFWDKHTPFTGRSPGFQVPGIGTATVSNVSWIVGGLTVVGLGAHALGSSATGRIKNPPSPTPVGKQTTVREEERR